MESFLTTTLDVAIGVVFVLLILSMLVSAINEWVVRQLELRADMLGEGFRNLLKDGQNEGLARQVSAHPLIAALTRGRDGKGKGPSYIPSKRFAQALIDVVGRQSPSSGAPQGASSDGAATARPSPAEALADLPDGPAKDALTALARSAGEDWAAFEDQVAGWFDDAMDRVSGWYKRRVQKFMIVIGLGLAVAFNVNVAHVAETLWKEPKLRALFVAEATEFGKRQEGEEPANSDRKDAFDRFQEMEKNLTPAVGWSPKAIQAHFPITLDLDVFWTWLTSVLGWIATALLISLGAPFWFNALNQLLDIRSAGRAPANAKSGPSGDAQPNSRT